MWARSLAALLLGLPLAVAIVGLAALLGAGPLDLRTLPSLLLFFPVWIGCIALAFWFRNGRQAWGWMGCATLVGFGLIELAKHFGALKALA